jgi:LPS sulfotransferase NodH
LAEHPLPFVIITTQRSGSRMLVDALNSHPQVVCHRELFKRDRRKHDSYTSYWSASWSRRVLRYALARRSARLYLEQVLASSPEASAVGFKVMYNQLRRHWELPKLFHRLDFRVIHLVRRNVLKTHLSTLAARRRGWRLAHDQRAVERVKVHLPTTGLSEVLAKRQRAIDAYRRRLRAYPLLEVAYEDFVAHPDAEAARILSFLGVDESVPLQVTSVKLNPDRLEDLLENHPEVESILRDTPFQELLR